MSDELINIFCKLKTTTKLAILVELEDENEYWIPKSVIELEDDLDWEDYEKDECININVKRWYLDKNDIDY